MSKQYINRYSSGFSEPPRFSLGNLFTAPVKNAFTGIFVVLLAVVFGFFVSLAVAPPEGVLILEYHKVNDWNDDTYTVPPDVFAAQMDILQAEGYTTISILDFLRAKKGKFTLPEKPVVLTFDDGYKDNYTVLLPILEARGMKATVFMATNRIGVPGYLSWDELHDMKARGTEIGSHTANHIALTEMSPTEAEQEMQLSKQILDWRGVGTVFTLSYPNGKFKDYMLPALERNEYLAAVTGDPGLNTFDTDPYKLQRVNVPRPMFGNAEFRFRLWKAKFFARLGLFQHKK